MGLGRSNFSECRQCQIKPYDRRPPNRLLWIAYSFLSERRGLTKDKSTKTSPQEDPSRISCIEGVIQHLGTQRCPFQKQTTQCQCPSSCPTLPAIYAQVNDIANRCACCSVTRAHRLRTAALVVSNPQETLNIKVLFWIGLCYGDPRFSASLTNQFEPGSVNRNPCRDLHILTPIK